MSEKYYFFHHFLSNCTARLQNSRLFGGLGKKLAEKNTFIWQKIDISFEMVQFGPIVSKKRGLFNRDFCNLYKKFLKY